MHELALSVEIRRIDEARSGRPARLRRTAGDQPSLEPAIRLL